MLPPPPPMLSVINDYDDGDVAIRSRLRINVISSALQLLTRQSEYKHILANILRPLFVARTPSEEARSPCRRSNVENAPVDGQSPASQPRPLSIYGAQF